MLKVRQHISGSFRSDQGTARFALIRGSVHTAAPQEQSLWMVLESVVHKEPWNPNTGEPCRRRVRLDPSERRPTQPCRLGMVPCHAGVLAHSFCHTSLATDSSQSPCPSASQSSWNTGPCILRGWRRLIVLSRARSLNPQPWGGSRSMLGRPGRSPLHGLELVEVMTDCISANHLEVLKTSCHRQEPNPGHGYTLIVTLHRDDGGHKGRPAKPFP